MVKLTYIWSYWIRFALSYTLFISKDKCGYHSTFDDARNNLGLCYNLNKNIYYIFFLIHWTLSIPDFDPNSKTFWIIFHWFKSKVHYHCSSTAVQSEENYYLVIWFFVLFFHITDGLVMWKSIISFFTFIHRHFNTQIGVCTDRNVWNYITSGIMKTDLYTKIFKWQNLKYHCFLLDYIKNNCFMTF